MVDEAHRTQEGRLGLDMREALPNAKFIGLTGTPISTDDRNTWETFGDPDDPSGVLNHYSRRAVHRRRRDAADPRRDPPRGLPHRPRRPRPGVRRTGRGRGARRGRARLSSPSGPAGSTAHEDPGPDRGGLRRHRRALPAKVAPLGLKAQVVAFDRELCVALPRRDQRRSSGPGEEATVVMTTAKDDPAAWAVWDRDRDEEARSMTGSSTRPTRCGSSSSRPSCSPASTRPIEGVMYLDKPLRAHTLFQAVTRTNRRWTNPATGQEKLYGLDRRLRRPGQRARQGGRGQGHRRPQGAARRRRRAVRRSSASRSSRRMAPFAGIDRTRPATSSCMAAQERLATGRGASRVRRGVPALRGAVRVALARHPPASRSRTTTAGWPASTPRSRPSVDAERAALAPPRREDARPHRRVHQRGRGRRRRGSRPSPSTRGRSRRSASSTCSTTSRRSRARAADRRRGPRHDRERGYGASSPGHDAIRSGVRSRERLEELRRARVDGRQDSVEFLKRLLELARQVVEAERAEADGRLDAVRGPRPRQGRADPDPGGVRAAGRAGDHRARRRGDRRDRPAHPRHRLAGEPARRPRGPSPAPARPQEQRTPPAAASCTTGPTPTSASTTEARAVLMVVFGAGASYDSVDDDSLRVSRDANFRPPLANELFADRPQPMGTEVLDRYPAVRAVASEVRAAAGVRDVEDILAGYQARASEESGWRANFFHALLPSAGPLVLWALLVPATSGGHELRLPSGAVRARATRKCFVGDVQLRPDGRVRDHKTF